MFFLCYVSAISLHSVVLFFYVPLARPSPGSSLCGASIVTAADEGVHLRTPEWPGGLSVPVRCSCRVRPVAAPDASILFQVVLAEFPDQEACGAKLTVEIPGVYVSFTRCSPASGSGQTTQLGSQFLVNITKLNNETYGERSTKVWMYIKGKQCKQLGKISTGPTLLSSFTVILDAYRSFIRSKTTFTKYCLTKWISKLPGPRGVWRLASGWHSKRNCLQDRANFHRSRVWQIVLICNTGKDIAAACGCCVKSCMEQDAKYTIIVYTYMCCCLSIVD